ncbi:Lrp/AsnC family transcriptional regulator [Methanolobus halotolerans]|uniref:Lrp/AsnC family transcriptional regulator n=1 Tax=Methanolobus halotolerans TaxID=2052935 RepID=A0A4E0PXJ9_9EURY|nr:Lrp/AsnC family transcriptional regulator [Methanolobus halotolerans]TGC10761.1 Lrp/AsnC family transcriptional regulator [Methanolobus halotolerans]
MDEVDIAILEQLSGNCRKHSTVIANELGVATSTVHKRIEKMHASGVIKEFTIKVDPEVVGFNITTFIGIDLEPNKSASVIEQLNGIDDILEIYELLEPYDLLLKVKTFDVYTLKEKVLVPISGMEGIKKSESILTTKCHKEESLSIRKKPLIP